MRAIEDLNLTGRGFGRHHRMKKADNIHKFAEASELFDLFYHEKAGTSVVRCIPSFIASRKPMSKACHR